MPAKRDRSQTTATPGKQLSAAAPTATKNRPEVVDMTKEKEEYKYKLCPGEPPALEPVYSEKLDEFDVPANEGLWKYLETMADCGMQVEIEKGKQLFPQLTEEVHSLISGLWSSVTGKATNPTTLKEVYLPQFSKEQLSKIPFGGDTDTDEAFAYQQLNGCQPYFIKRVEGELPSSCSATDADAAAVVGAGTTLAGLIAAERLFIIDTSDVMKGYWSEPVLAGHVNAVPVALFYIDEANGRLMPLAIQLFPGAGRPGIPNPVFTPKDDANVWLAAKLFVNNTLTSLHSCGQHICYAHIYGAVCIAFRRCLPPQGNALYDLTYGFSDTMIAKGGVFTYQKQVPWKTELVKANYKLAPYDAINVPRDVAERGVADIPHYHWRTESLAEYAVFEKFVTAVVDASFADDNAVRADPYLADLATELLAEDMVNLKGCVLNRNTSGKFESKADVVEFFTTFCYYCSARFCYDTVQWPWYVWIPATPADFRMEPMTTKDPIKFEDIVNSLDAPFSKDATFQYAGIMAIAHLSPKCSRLTTGGPNGNRFPLIPGWLSRTPALAAARDEFFRDLATLETQMRARDEQRVKDGDLPMEAMYPTKQCCTIWY